MYMFDSRWELIPREAATDPTAGCGSYRMAIDTELFYGEAQALLRMARPSDNGRYHTAAFEGQTRTLQVQWQGRFRRQPKGPICVALQLVDPTSTMGIVTKKMVQLAEGYMRGVSPLLKISTGCKGGRVVGICCPAAGVLGVRTQSLDEPRHPLGTRLEEAVYENTADAESLTTVDLQRVYTIELYSNNVHLDNWQLTGIPGVSTISLASLLSVHPQLPFSSAFSVFLHERIGDEVSGSPRLSPLCAMHTCHTAHDRDWVVGLIYLWCRMCVGRSRGLVSASGWRMWPNSHHRRKRVAAGGDCSETQNARAYWLPSGYRCIPPPRARSRARQHCVVCHQYSRTCSESRSSRELVDPRCCIFVCLDWRWHVALHR